VSLGQKVSIVSLILIVIQEIKEFPLSLTVFMIQVGVPGVLVQINPMCLMMHPTYTMKYNGKLSSRLQRPKLSWEWDSCVGPTPNKMSFWFLIIWAVTTNVGEYGDVRSACLGTKGRFTHIPRDANMKN